MRRKTMVAMVSCLALATAATQAWAASWQIQTTPNPSTTENYLNGVTALSSSDAWAVGTFDNSNGTRRTLAEQFDGSSWTKVSTPNKGTVDTELNGVRGTSASNVWAVGFYADSSLTNHPLIEHFDGSSWTISTSPNQAGAKLLGVGASSASNAWAVGLQPSGAFTERYDGSQWSIVNASMLQGAQLWGVTTTGSSNAWAAGYFVDANSHWKTLIEHYDGTGWTKVASPNQSSTLNQLLAVSANSASDVWAVGQYVHDTDQKLRIMILHYDGTSWRTFTHPDKLTDDYVTAVKAVSASDVWAVGGFKNSAGFWKTLIEHFDGTSWTIQASPNGTGQDNHLSGVASTGSSNSFAVGWDGVVTQTTKTLAMHCPC